MDGQDKTFSIRNATAIFSADVFYHPLWLHFNIQDPAEAAPLAVMIKHEIKRLITERQWLDACRASIICAYLQNVSGNVGAALGSLHYTRSIASRRGFFNVVIWAGWGASAICLQDKAYQKSAEHLLRLEKELNRTSQWVLADLIDLVRQTVLEQVVHSNTVLSAGKSPGEDVVGWLYQQLLCWGKPSFPPEPGIWVENGLSDKSSSAEIMERRAGSWRTFWNNLKRLFRTDIRYEINEVRKMVEGRRQHPILALPAKATTDPSIQDVARANAPEEIPAQVSQKANTDPQSEPATQITGLAASPPIIPVTSGLPVERQQNRRVPLPDHTPSLAVYCLGSFKVFVNNRLIDGWNGQKGTSILKYLVANRERPVAKDILMYLFWPDADAEVARRNLHQAIYALRQTLRRALPDPQLILFENDCYRINSKVDIWLDFEEFERFARAGRDHLEAGQLAEAMDAFGVAEELYRGDFLEEELYEDWPQSQREYYRTRYLEIAAEISAHYIKKRQTTPAMMLCQKVLARDRCNELAYRGLIQCYLIQGQRQLAIREYQVCVQMLKDELGLPPSEETLALYRQITER